VTPNFKTDWYILVGSSLEIQQNPSWVSNALNYMGRTTTAKLPRWERTNYTVIIVVEERVKVVVEPDGTQYSATT
jgi:hypothetical protein